MPFTKGTDNSHHDFLTSVCSPFFASFLQALVVVPYYLFSLSSIVLEFLSDVAVQNKTAFPSLP